MNTYLRVVLLVCISSVLLFPISLGAVTGKDLGLFQCSGPDCTFDDAVRVANGAMNALFVAVLVVAPLFIAKAGYHYVIGGNKPAERTKANMQLRNIAVGLLIIAGAYAFVKLVLDVLLGQTTLSNILFK